MVIHNGPEQRVGQEDSHINYHFEVVPIVTEKDKYKIMERAEPFHDLLVLTKGRNYEELYNNLEVGGEAIFAVLDGPDLIDIGIVEGRLKRVVLGAGEEVRVYKRNLRAVKKEYQKHKVGQELTNYIVKTEAPDAFTGRTPNPYVIRADEESPYITTIFPVHKLYSPKAELVLLRTLDEAQIAEMDRRTGICRGVYPPGENRLFCLDGASERVIQIYKRMTDPPSLGGLGANLQEGDGIRYLEWVIRNPHTLGIRTLLRP